MPRTTCSKFSPASRAPRLRALARGPLVLGALIAAVALPSTASATVTKSTVAVPPSPSFFQVTNDGMGVQTNPDVVVSGTTDGATGDSVDLVCENSNFDSSVFAGGVPVAANGTFTSTVPASDLDDVCRIRAIPSGTPFDAAAAQYVPALVSRSRFEQRVSNSKVTEFTLRGPTPGADLFHNSAGNCGNGLGVRGAALDTNYYGWDCGGTLNARGQFNNRSAINLDGRSVFTPYGARDTNYSQGFTRPGYEGMTVTQTFDSTNGAVAYTETEPLLDCVDAVGKSLGGSTSTSDLQCDHFVNTGVTLQRVSTSRDGNLSNRQQDTFSSTSGSHVLKLAYENFADYNDEETVGTKLPGSGSYVNYGDYGQTVAAPATAPATLLHKLNASAPASAFTNPVSALTYDQAPDAFQFANAYRILLNYTRTINDGAPAVLTHTYRVSGSDAAIAAASQISGPVLTVNTPTEGQVTSNPSLQVSGTVTDEGDVKSLTVNNLPTTVTPDGGFTQTVALNEGANTITVVATDTAGKSATVTRKVTLTSKSSSCTVPNVAGKAVAAAQTAIEAAGCTLGTQSLATSKTVANGSVVSQSQAAGRKVSAFYPVDLVVSAGKPALVRLGSGTVKLKNRTLSVQLRCPAGSSKVCSGTAKIRTTSGKGSTLGTRAFQTPAGQKRKVTFVLSKAAARRIHKAGRVKADVFVVSRDIDGKAQSTKLKLTIVG